MSEKPINFHTTEPACRYKFPNMPSPEWAEMQRKFAETTLRLVREKHLVEDRLTEEQLAEAIRQMLLSGDIMVNVIENNPPDMSKMFMDLGATPKQQHEWEIRQSVTYIPFREVDRLRDEIDALKIRLANAAEMLKAAGATQAAIDGVLFDYVEEGDL